MPPRRMAAIDVGSNSIHMIIVEDRGDGYRVLDKEKEMVQLARGSLGGEPLTAEAIFRGVAALEKMGEIARRWEAADIVAVATSAVREAPNGREFVERAEAASGIRVDIVSGEQEADLIYRAIRSAVDFKGGTALCIDIGGGSIELVVGTDSEVYFAHSAPLGAIRLAERFLRSDPPTAEQIAACRKHVRKSLRKTLNTIATIGFDFCIGSSGTINALAELAGRQTEDAVASGLRWLERDELATLLDRLAPVSASKRIETFGIDPKRAESILSGGLALHELLIAVDRRRMRACTAALREGIVETWLAESATPRDRAGGVRQSAIAELADRSECDRVHASHVARLALRIFEQTRGIHKLDDDARELLEAAAMLHEVGMHVSFKAHHRHTYYLIRHAGLRGFTHDQVLVIANVARYYRKAPPDPSDENIQELTPDLRRTVQRLAAILRIAAALDRGRRQAIRDVGVDVAGRVVRFHVRPRLDPDVELDSARKRARYFSELFERKVELHGGPDVRVD
ncbi:MAG: Ppx/GppA family phosphatase [Acidobacteria bacterium]|nr:Ppx/GppA family phosphatase [Acidobacteriota bacterium]